MSVARLAIGVNAEYQQYFIALFLSGGGGQAGSVLLFRMVLTLSATRLAGIFWMLSRRAVSLRLVSYMYTTLYILSHLTLGAGFFFATCLAAVSGDRYDCRHRIVGMKRSMHEVFFPL